MISMQSTVYAANSSYLGGMPVLRVGVVTNLQESGSMQPKNDAASIT